LTRKAEKNPGAYERHAGAIDPQSRRAAESYSRISQNEDNNCGVHPERSGAHGAIAHFAIALGVSASKSRVSGMPKKYSRNPEAAIPAKTRKAAE
jgi:hypothetical protein